MTTMQCLHDTINKSLFKNNFIFDGPISSIAVISSTRYYSTKRFFNSIRPLANSEESLALDFINNEKSANAFIINKILFYFHIHAVVCFSLSSILACSSCSYQGEDLPMNTALYPLLFFLLTHFPSYFLCYHHQKYPLQSVSSAFL